MREFDINGARAGRKVTTREGYPVRLFAFDCRNFGYPIVGAFEYEGNEYVVEWSEKGELFIGEESHLDLVMAEEEGE